MKQLRPLVTNQPWAVFYIEFESKRLPVTALRRVLNRFVEKKRVSVADRPTWKTQTCSSSTPTAAATTVASPRALLQAGSPLPTRHARVHVDPPGTHLAHIQNYIDCLRWPEDGTRQKTVARSVAGRVCGVQAQGDQGLKRTRPGNGPTSRMRYASVSAKSLKSPAARHRTRFSSSTPPSAICSFTIWPRMISRTPTPRRWPTALFAARAAHPDESFS